MWFLVLTGGLGTWDAIDPPRRPDPIGQEGVHFHNRRLVASIENGTRMRIVDEDLERRSNLNAILTPWYAGALLHTLDEAGHEVVVGEDGWLFLQTRIHPPLGDLGQIEWMPRKATGMITMSGGRYENRALCSGKFCRPKAAVVPIG